MLQKISMLQLRLDENQKSLQLERDEKSAMHQNVEKLVQELQDVRDKCEELRGAKQDAIRELLTLQEQQRAELRIINNSLMEEISARECLERRIAELRIEVCLLQKNEKFEKKNKIKFSIDRKSWNDCKPKTPMSGENANDSKQRNWHWNVTIRKLELKFVTFKKEPREGDGPFPIPNRSTEIYSKSWLTKTK